MYLKDLDLLQSVLLGGFFGHETESAIVVVLFNSAYCLKLLLQILSN